MMMSATSIIQNPIISFIFVYTMFIFLGQKQITKKMEQRRKKIVLRKADRIKVLIALNS